MAQETFTVTAMYSHIAVKNVMEQIAGRNDVSETVSSLTVSEGESYVNDEHLRVKDFDVTVQYE